MTAQVKKARSAAKRIFYIIRKRIVQLKGNDKTAQQHKQRHGKRNKSQIKGIVAEIRIIGLDRMGKNYDDNRNALERINMDVASGLSDRIQFQKRFHLIHSRHDFLLL